MEALQEKSEAHQSHLGYIIWEPQMSVQCLCQVDVLDVEIFNWISEAFHPLALHELSGDHQSHWDSSSGYNEFLYQIPWELSRHFTKGQKCHG